MFFEAFAKAKQFTFPFMISKRMLDGRCTSELGALVVINDEGWFLTAAHLFKAVRDAQTNHAETVKRLAEEDKIKNDPALDHKAKQKQLRKLPFLDRSKAIENYSTWLVRDGVRIVQAHAVAELDLGLGRIQPWEKDWVKTYPKIKDPAKDFDCGRSLCKLGYPFAVLNTTYDTAVKAFRVEGVPPPLFPIDGILTRFEERIITDAAGKPLTMSYPYKFIETSSPGLRGQSGGPTFDVNGDIWAIQSETVTYSLDLKAEKVADRTIREHVEHQFFNVGRGIHAESIIGFLTEKRVKFEMA